jgi:LysR family transcriptional regulator, glycine cleavage system transcriptional activator
MPPFTALRAFYAVGLEKGIRAAGSALNVDHAAIARHVRNLEAWLGVELLDRSRQPALLTPAGENFHARISSAMNEMQSAVSEIMDQSDDGTLTVWCVPGLALHWLAPRLVDFHRSYPNIKVELRPSDFPPDLLLGEADIDIRYVRNWALPTSSKIRCLELARPAVFPVANPDMEDINLNFDEVKELLNAQLILEDDASEWREWFRHQEIDYVESASGIRLWHAHLCLDAARRKQGIALTNSLLASEDLASGRLVKLTPQRQSLKPVALGAYTLMADARKWSNPSVTIFRRWVYISIEKGSGNIASQPAHPKDRITTFI